MGHSRALRAVISGLPSHCRRPPGPPGQSRTRTTEKDLSALIIGLNTAWRRAQDREQWQRTVEAAMLHHALGDNDACACCWEWSPRTFGDWLLITGCMLFVMPNWKHHSSEGVSFTSVREVVSWHLSVCLYVSNFTWLFNASSWKIFYQRRIRGQGMTD